MSGGHYVDASRSLSGKVGNITNSLSMCRGWERVVGRGDKRQVFSFGFGNPKYNGNRSASDFSAVCTCNALLPLVYRAADHVYVFFVKFLGMKSLDGFHRKHITMPWLCFYCGLHKIFHLHSY